MEKIRDTIRAYLLETFLPGESPQLLTDATPLLTGGILDSIATMRLVSHLESLYGIQYEAYELTVDDFETIQTIAQLTHRKIADQQQ